MSAARLAGLHPGVLRAAELALAWAEYFGIPVRVTSGFRSLEEQARLRSNWELGRSPYPANRPGDSAHNFGLAWDSVVDPRDQADWNTIRRWIGFSVPENDEIHAEVPGWRQYV